MLRRFIDRDKDRIIRQTFLSRKPRGDSHLMAFISWALIFLISLFYWQADPSISGQMVASGKTVFGNFEWWRWLVSPYIHSGVKHFIANSPMFAILIYLIYGYYGLRPALMLILPGAWLIHGLTLLSYPPEVGLLGISGVVYALCGFWLALYMGIDRRRPWPKRLLRSLGFALVILIPTTFEANVSHMAHGVGFVVGVAYGIGYFFYHKENFRSMEVVEIETTIEDPYFFQ